VRAAQLEAEKVRGALESEKNRYENIMEVLRREAADEKSMASRLETENGRLLEEIEHQRQLKSALQAELMQKDGEIHQMRLDAQKREQSAREIVASDMKQLRLQLAEAQVEVQKQKTEWQEERKNLEAVHGSELSTVSAKVKSLMEGKDATIQALKEQLGVAQTRLLEIEQLFHEQKKALLAKK
jgi:SMC interacting uncharacterized protein involved in chromosome segregation